MSSILSWFRNARRAHSPRRRRLMGSGMEHSRVGCVEQLEERSLLSVLLLSAGTATYTASNSIKNNLNIFLDGANYVFIESGASDPGALADNITVAGSGSGGCVGNGTTIVT